jgi:glycerol kinase
MKKYILSLDAGTTSNRAILFDHAGKIVAKAQKEFEQIFPKPGLVEHDPEEIWETQLWAVNEVLKKSDIKAEEIAGIGITNQRETTVIWDRETGKPVHNAIVWQDRRTSWLCDQLNKSGQAPMIKEKTGLVIDAYFSGTKVKWLFDNVDGLKDKAADGRIAFGTIDSWLIYKLSGGKTHVTDVTNASRTLLYNIHDLKWDKEILELLDVPENILPEVKSSSEVYTETDPNLFGESIPISGIAGDQQAALFGQMCIEPGMVKNTYGTGCFVVMNTGKVPVTSYNNLLTTIAWQLNGETIYALEGSIFIGGAVVQWLRDQLGIIENSEEVEELASSVSDNGGLTFVPAFAGLGAPHWDQYARGLIIGLTRGSNKAHIARAALESIALSVSDVITTAEKDSEEKLTELRVDGGASINNILMQFQSDILQCEVIRPEIVETTALGAAYLAGIAVDFWSLDDIKKQWKEDKRFRPGDYNLVSSTVRNWEEGVKRSMNWEKED